MDARFNTCKLELMPYPDGKEFAVSFVDDTDESKRDNTEPVYAFLDSHNMMGTKTVWIMRKRRPSEFRLSKVKSTTYKNDKSSTLEDEGYFYFIQSLAEKGFEIALHGVSGGNNFREEIIEGIERFKKLFADYPKIYAFHERNIENLYAGCAKLDFWFFKLLEKLIHKSQYQGHIENSPYFWGDVAKEKIKYMRLPFHTINEVNTLKVSPNMPFHDEQRPYVNYWFASSDGSDCSRFIKLLRKENVDRIKKENGACIIYTHFAKGFADPNNGYCLHRGFEDVIKYLCSHSDVWLPTATKLLDRLLSLQEVWIEQHGKDLYLKNESVYDVEDITVRGTEKTIIINEKGLECKKLSGDKINLGTISAKTTTKYRSNEFLHFSTKRKIGKFIIRRERKMIELYNYIGLIKQKIDERVHN